MKARCFADIVEGLKKDHGGCATAACAAMRA
jgi:hypothetical protein